MSELIDNRAQRIRTLKDVIRHLHEGRAPADVKSRLAALVRECDASEIAAMEQELMAEGVPVQEIMGMCDLHSQVVRDILVERASVPPAPGHPVDTFRRENEALAAQAARLREALGGLAAGEAEDAAASATQLLKCRELFGALMDVEKHYQRKEHLLFSCLERHGITGPSTVMWGKHDQARALLKDLGTALAEGGATVAEWRLVSQSVAERALAAVEEMIFKEEHILLPMSLQTLTEIEWGEIFDQTPRFGYCLVDPGVGWEPPREANEAPAHATAATARSSGACAPATLVAGARAIPLAMAGASAAVPQPAAPQAGTVVLPTGALSLVQLKAVFSTLPVDLTFIDAEDRVRFFSEGKERIFQRPKTILGRLVQHCHPPGSVDVVNRILADFRSGAQNVAEFWIDFRGRFAHIRYFALRDEQGAYVGTLEVTQDLTRERALEGERRLLEYETQP